MAVHIFQRVRNASNIVLVNLHKRFAKFGAITKITSKNF